MERDFNNDEFDDFELFLKQKVDQHKLFPSDKAWKGIYNSLHPGMKWFKIGGSLLVVTSLIFIFQQTTFFGSSNSPVKHKSLNNSNNKVPQTITADQTVKSPATAFQNTSKQHKSAIKITAKPAVPENNELVQTSNSVLIGAENKDNLANEVTKELKGFMLHHNNVQQQRVPISVNIPVSQVTPARENENTEIVADKELQTSAVTANAVGEEDLPVNDVNWLQEMAAIKLTPQKKSRFNLQFYFSPTISYRRLADNQNMSGFQQSISAPSRDLNVNKYVDHNPSIGAELGSNILFSATRNLIFKSGLQLNYSRYNIKAFKFYTEKASIALNTAGPVADTISSYTSLRNFNGYFPEDLQNQYLQVSVPVGAELRLLGSKRLQLNVAGTIQPTFLLFSDTYLLSSNYLNYTKEPSLVRKWNVHSSFEAFLSYEVGGLRWQLGPQFRYQLMSSYNDRYPIKEYLFEYGIKIGISKTLR